MEFLFTPSIANPITPRQLICYAKRLADEFKLPLLASSIIAAREAKARLYERHLHKAGLYFIYNLDALEHSAPAWHE